MSKGSSSVGKDVLWTLKRLDFAKCSRYSHCQAKTAHIRQSRPESGLVFLWEGFRESRRCSRDTYPEWYITEYTSVYGDKSPSTLQVVPSSLGSGTRGETCLGTGMVCPWDKKICPWNQNHSKGQTQKFCQWHQKSFHVLPMKRKKANRVNELYSRMVNTAKQKTKTAK